MRAWGIHTKTLWDGDENWKENAGENMAEFQNILWENSSFIVYALGSHKAHSECHSWAQVLPLAQILPYPEHVNTSLRWGHRSSPGMSRHGGDPSAHSLCGTAHGQLRRHRRAAPEITFAFMVTSDGLAIVPFMHTSAEPVVISEPSLSTSWSWTLCSVSSRPDLAYIHSLTNTHC